MKATRAQIERALDTAAPDIRMFLLYGPDESGSRALAARLGPALGSEVERVDLSSSTLKTDPASLPDEAASMSLFGGRRYIRVEGASDDILDAVSALLAAPSAGNPVVLLSESLRKESKLLKLALADSRALAFSSYVPEGADADRLVLAIARERGLRVGPDVARRLAAATGGDRALLIAEIDKLALYIDASPERPGAINQDALEALGADLGDSDLSRLVDSVLDGRSADADEEILRLGARGTEGIMLIRALLRRLLLLAELRGEIARGNSVEAAMSGGAARSIFWKDRAAVSSQLARWSPSSLETALRRLLDAERDAKRTGASGAVAVNAELLAISQAAQRMR